MPSVLIVEDEPAIRDMLDAVLTGEGCETHLAVAGRHGIALVARRLSGVALFDLMLPLLDGASAIRALRDDQRTRSIRIVAMSANAMMLSGIGGMADAILLKPFDLDDLLAVLQRRLGAPA